MKAYIAESPGVLKMIDTHKPKPGPYDVLARVKYTGICGTDLAIISGQTSFVRDGLIKYPVRIGHEWSGIVEEVGKDVVDFAPGDRVVGDNAVPCGRCRNCLSGNSHLCANLRSVGTVNTWDGAFAEYMVMPAHLTYRLPESVDLKEAALIEPTVVSFVGLLRAEVRIGSHILIIGTGPIGCAAVTLAHAMGATQIIVCGRKDPKLSVCSSLGADTVINVTRDNLVAAVKEATGGEGVDSVIETSGAISVLNDALEVSRVGSRLSLVGFFERDLDGFHIDKVVLSQISVVGSTVFPGVFPRVIELLALKKISLRPLITGVFPFGRMADAVRSAQENKDSRIKVLVEQS